MEDTQAEMVMPAVNKDEENAKADTKAAKARRIAESERLYNGWKLIIPKLVDSYLTYMNTTMSRSLPPAPDMISNSACGCLLGKNHELICLYSDCESQIQFYCDLILIQMADVKVVRVQECACRLLPDLLILHGLFPSAPAQPHFAVSIELLKLYHALFEQSCDAVNALAAVLGNSAIPRIFQVRLNCGVKKIACLNPWYDRFFGQCAREDMEKMMRKRSGYKPSNVIQTRISRIYCILLEAEEQPRAIYASYQQQQQHLIDIERTPREQYGGMVVKEADDTHCEELTDMAPGQGLFAAGYPPSC